MQGSDGPLNHMIKLLEKTKAMPPEDWNNAFDWDKKPVPPDVDFLDPAQDDESGDEQAENEWLIAKY